MQSRLEERHDVALFKLREGLGLELGDVGGGRGARRAGVGNGARDAGVGDRGGDDVCGVTFGELEASLQESLADLRSIFGGDEDEILVVGGNEEDWDAGQS